MLLSHSYLIQTSNLIGWFSVRFDNNSEVAYFLLGHQHVYVLSMYIQALSYLSQGLSFYDLFDSFL